MTPNHRRLDRHRASQGEIANHTIDELLAGRISRREFVRRGSVLGLSATAMGAILAACGNANSPSSSSSSNTGAAGASSGSSGKAGGTLKLAQQTPAASINPLTIADAGGLNLLAQTGEYLVFDSNATLKLEPMLATSWSANQDGSVWTFHLRSGVKFHTGQTMTADDVVWTLQQLSDTKNASNALSNFAGVLTPSGVRKVNAHTVAFHLEAPNGNFPYLVSSDNYNAIIVPKGTDYGKWQSTFVGTGPFKLKSYTQNVGASFVPNPDYWGTKPLLSATEFSFYQSQQPQILALQGGQVDVIVGIVATGAQALLNSSEYSIISRKSAGHREISMRTDLAPFNDARVRRALALTLDRPVMVKGLLYGRGSVGNDSPFGPRFPSTDTSVPQRVQDIAQAKQLLAAAGHPSGFKAVYTSETILEMPALAQVIQADARRAGIDLTLKIENQSAYYGKSTFGNSDWLDAEVSGVDYGDRGAPNIYLEAPLTSKGVWNAARFKDPAYDQLVQQYVASVDLQTQRAVAGKIERLLLEQTPLLIPYFLDSLTPTKPNVQGANPTSIGAIYLGKASVS
jgi:peptide/nickel transport system substrate-binding protein